MYFLCYSGISKLASHYKTIFCCFRMILINFPFDLRSTPTMNRQSDNSFINKMKASGRNIVVFYGSQTGTAEEFAGRLAKEAQRYGMKGMVADPEECGMEELTQLGDIENSLAIFCMATYGEGDPTDNAQEFYEWLQQGDCELTGLNFAVGTNECRLTYI